MLLFSKVLPPKKTYQLRNTVNISFYISILVVIYILIRQTKVEWKNCPSMSAENSSATPPLQIGNRSPYLGFVVSAVPNRFNFTKSTLNSWLRGIFNLTHRKSVNKTDPRIYGSVGVGAASLMLTYIDLWKEIALKPASELAENDWIFLFEDDVDIVPLVILETFYNRIYMQWNQTNPSIALAGTIELHSFFQE